MRKQKFGGDLIIAAIAITQGANLATRNVRDFRLIAEHCSGLSCVEPWTGETF